MGKHRGKVTVEIGLWNAHNASPDRLATVVGHIFEHAHVIVLNEVWRRHDALKSIARGTRRDLHQEKPRGRGGKVVAEEGSTAVLTAKDTDAGRGSSHRPRAALDRVLGATRSTRAGDW